MSGAQSLAPACPTYDAGGDMYALTWKTSKSGTGGVTITVEVTYPGAAAIQSAPEQIVVR